MKWINLLYLAIILNLIMIIVDIFNERWDLIPINLLGVMAPLAALGFMRR